MSDEAAIFAVIFDMDGVLVDSGPAHKKSWQLLGRERGRPITDREFAASFGRTNADIIRTLFGEVAESEMKAIADRKEHLYREIVRGRVPIMPGATQLVVALAAEGFEVAIGSSGPPENIALVVDAMGIEMLLSAYVTGLDVQRGKPDPQVFLLAAARVGISPDRCVVVEDAPAGIEAAKRAGMKAIALASSHPVKDLGNADLIVHALSEITPARIRALIG